MEPTERDREIVRLVAKHRFLRSSQIVTLLGETSQPILRRLHLLFHHGYLERPRAQLDYYHLPGSRSIVYGLGNKGATLVTDELARPRPRFSCGDKNRSVGRIYLEHALFVSDTMVALELACRGRDDVRLLSAEECRIPESAQAFCWKVDLRSDLRLGVIPDHVFAIEKNLGSDKPERVYFFLEADRGTMPVKRKELNQTSIHRKILAYEATWSQSLHRTLFGFHRFRVLIVTPTSARLDSIVGTCSELQRGRGLFLFADKTILEKPNDLLGRIWKTPSGGTASLLD
jgi:DNA-binding Lrp family transcriptional regulator